MKLCNLLVEGMSPVVFHITSFPAAKQILTSDFIKGPILSTTRSLTGSYHSSNKLIGVIFKLDGNKLNQQYKGAPIGTENFDYDQDDYDPNDKDTWQYAGRDNKQLEDRLQIPKGLKDATKYITQAIIYIPIEYLDDARDKFDSNYLKQLQSYSDVIKLLQLKRIDFKIAASSSDLSKIKYLNTATTIETLKTGLDKKFGSNTVTGITTGQQFVATVIYQNDDLQQKKFTIPIKNVTTIEQAETQVTSMIDNYMVDKDGHMWLTAITDSKDNKTTHY